MVRARNLSAFDHGCVDRIFSQPGGWFCGESFSIEKKDCSEPGLLFIVDALHWLVGLRCTFVIRLAEIGDSRPHHCIEPARDRHAKAGCDRQRAISIWYAHSSD